MTEGGRFAASHSSSTWYRSDQQRFRSVYRRANPWYRRVTRALIGLAAAGALGIGVFVGIAQLQDYLDRDKLPAPGAEPPAFRSTAFLIKSTAPAPEIDGTLNVDTSTRAYQFVGSPGGPQENLEIVSPDGSRAYLRNALGPWRPASAGDQIAVDLQTVIPHLIGVTDSDDVLINRLRQGGYVDLVDKTEIGTGDVVDQYDMMIDTQSFSNDYPLQWEQLREGVVPAMVESAALAVRMSIDDEQVVIGIDDGQTHWSWQRLNYSAAEFVPLDPAAS